MIQIAYEFIAEVRSGSKSPTLMRHNTAHFAGYVETENCGKNREVGLRDCGERRSVSHGHVTDRDRPEQTLL